MSCRAPGGQLPNYCELAEGGHVAIIVRDATQHKKAGTS
jgi:hypothetical protein